MPALGSAAAVLACLAFASPTAAQTGGQCIDTPSDPGICLLDDGFKVTVEWAELDGNPFTLPSNLDGGQGQGETLDAPTSGVTVDSGYFWFFTPDNIELLVKMVDGRSELFLRTVGPKPNGFLQPNVVKFSTSQIEVWIEQLSTGLVNYYLLEGATPGNSDLTGFFDRFGFGPGS